MRPRVRRSVVMAFAQVVDQRTGVVVARRGPAGLASFGARPFLVGQVAFQHRRKAVEVAAPVELLRRPEITAAAPFECTEQPRRLVVVILLPADRQRRAEPFAGHQREREVDQREPREHRIDDCAGRGWIEMRGTVRDADVVALDVEVNELQRVNLVERGEAVMRERPPVRAVVEDAVALDAVARNGQQRGPLIDGHPGVVRLHESHSAARASVELHDVGHADDPVPDQARENPPFALGPEPEIRLIGGEEAFRVAPSVAGRHRFAEYLDMLARRHLQATAAENALDMLGGHGFALSE